MAGIVSYIRVSTEKQGQSGLGMQSQAEAVQNYAKHSGKRIIAQYVEVESGRNSARPELQKALNHARRNGAVLCVAKLDRLARHARFLLTILEGGADVVFCDMPNIPPGPAGKMILTTMAGIAEWEAAVIGQRTRDALQQAKARGKLLGSARPGHWEGREDRRLAGAKAGAEAAAKVHRQAAASAYADLTPMMTEWRAAGLSLVAIAERLNAEGHTTRRGRPWGPVQVLRVLQRTSDGNA
jgi:DNA invertase Pin-like site-specific DNA recombinase